MDFNKVWQNFQDTVTGHYVDFNGRVGRAQFWYYILVYVVLAVAVSIVASVTTHALSTLFGLAMLLPNLGMTVRRLHDTNKPAIYVLILLVPAVLSILMGLVALAAGPFGFLAFLFLFASVIWLIWLVAAGIMIYFCAQPGDAGDNQYGPPPPVWTPNA